MRPPARHLGLTPARFAVLVAATAVLAGTVVLPVTALASGSPHGVTRTMPSPPRLASGPAHSVTSGRPGPTRLAAGARGAPALIYSQQPTRGVLGAAGVDQLPNLGLPAPREQTTTVRVTTLTGRHPIARAATTNINAIVPRFEFFLVYDVLSPLTLRLRGFLIGPFHLGFESGPYGGCKGCAGPGSFTAAKVFRKGCGSVPAPCLRESLIGGTTTLTKRSLFIEAITAPDKIGRFTVYGVQVNPAKPKIRRQGCLGADVPVIHDNFLAYLGGAKTIPTVPCNQTVTNDPLPSLSPPPPFEVSSSGPTPFEISGSASGTEWLGMFEVHHDCEFNSQATAQLEPRAPRLFTQVTGQFTKIFRTATHSTPGFLCFFLQRGGTFKGIPDGRVTMADQVAYLAGDTVGISGPTTTPPPQVTETYAGNASVAGEEFWTFPTPSPCQGSVQAEYAQDPHPIVRPLNAGQFSFQISTNGLVSGETVDLCAYTQLGAPVNGAPNGSVTLAGAEQVVTVS